MDAINCLIKKSDAILDELYDKITSTIQAIDSTLPIYYQSNPIDISDYPDTYVYVAINPQAHKAYAMCIDSFSLSFSVLIDIRASAVDTTKAEQIAQHVNYLFLRGISEKYSFLIGTPTQVTAPTTSGIRIVLNETAKTSIQL